MPELKWDKQDFLECLGVVPEEGEFGIDYVYTVVQEELTLVVAVEPFCAMIHLTLQLPSQPQAFLHMSFVVRGRTRYVNDERGEWLEIRDCIHSPTTMPDWDIVDACEAPTLQLNIEIIIRPRVEIRFV